MAPDDLRAFIARYDAAWNAQDLEAICAAHAPGMVFHNHTADERVEGDAVRGHIAQIFANWPDLRFADGGYRVGDDFVVSEWTATATHRDGRRLEWDGIDVFPFAGGLIARKDVWSNAHRARVLGGGEGR